MSTIPNNLQPGEADATTESNGGLLSKSSLLQELISTVQPAPIEPVPSSSSDPLLSQPTTPKHRPAYLDLPDHKIFLDIPPAADPLIQYITSALQHDGKRHTAERRVKRMLLFLHTLTRAEPLPLLREAIFKVSPSVRTVRHRHATKEIIIPVALKEKQQVRRAVHWMLKESESRGGRTVEERLAREIVLVLNGTSKALNSRDALHKLAMVNRYIPVFLPEDLILTTIPTGEIFQRDETTS